MGPGEMAQYKHFSLLLLILSGLFNSASSHFWIGEIDCCAEHCVHCALCLRRKAAFLLPDLYLNLPYHQLHSCSYFGKEFTHI